MIDFAMAHPFYAVLLAWLAVVGISHIAKVVVEIVRQPFLFYRHIADGRRIRKHRADMRKLYEDFGTTPAAQKAIASEFEAVEEEMGNVYRKVA